MCAAPNSSTQQPSASSTMPSTTDQKRNKPLHGGKNTFTNKQQGSSAKPNGPTRNEKRARWAKKSKPAVKPAVKRGPVKEYTSACCSALATKPAAGAKESFKDPESGKSKDKAKGLGKWRCTTCHKVTKVTPRKPEPPMANLSTRSPYPGPLTTPVLNIPPAPEGAVARIIVGGPIV